MPDLNLTPERLAIVFRSMALLFIGVPAIYAISKWLQRFASKKYTPQLGMIAGKMLLYAGIIFILFSELNELGFKLAHLFAAAGVLGIAVGFAAQTSFSNIISGFFLIAEQPFVVGDLITVGSTTGHVLSVDMLSVKLKTFDNRFVRIPNETIVKDEVINVTHFPIRRVDLNLSVAYKEDISKVRDILHELAYKNPLCLQEPEPVIIFSGFGSSSIDLFFGVWAEKTEFLRLKNSLQEEIKARFDQEGIEIPFPHVSLYRGMVSEPFQVEIVETSDKSAS